MLSKANRLRKNKEFNYIYKHGKVISCQYCTIYYVSTRYNTKFGISVSTKVGKSYIRSRCKRVLSEILRLNVRSIMKNNYVFVVKPNMVGADYFSVEKVVMECMKTAGLVC